ncbi:sensor histidine kinase [Edaphobacter sp. HDX4]|uniref:sensor histidine kinase n=1 Tax=Edaphobacter sp. HDX4 TaxID=2794064 RepID=UPI002FE655C5
MRARLWPAVAVSFTALLLLLTVFAWLVSREAAQIHERTRTARQVYNRADDAISDIQVSINKGTLIEQRGFSTASNADAVELKRRIADLQRRTAEDGTTLAEMLGSSLKPEIFALQQGLYRYWSSIQQSLGTLRTQHDEQGLLRELGNQLEKVLDLVGRIDSLNQASLAHEEREIEAQQIKLRKFAIAAMFMLLLLECTVAVFNTAYMAQLDKASDAERRRAEKAEQELRRLSNQLIQVQEEERKTISRELHDEVGQLLTGLRMELGTLSNSDPDDEFRERLESVKQLAEQSLRSVRNLALLVRPSMLDDLGLEPALHWQAKEFSRRYGIPVSVNVAGRIDRLPEAFRLCLYRAIQEAITNCGKHACAHTVTIAVKRDETQVSASVYDDGRGFDALTQTPGLGLLGMTERVRALNGRMAVDSQPGGGTLIRIELPARPDSSDPYR